MSEQVIYKFKTKTLPPLKILTTRLLDVVTQSLW